MSINAKFVTTTAAKLSSVTIKNGQIIALSDRDAMYYDMGEQRHTVTGNILDSALPATGETDVLYVINNTDPEVSGVYIWTGSKFVKISGLDNTKVKTESSNNTRVYLLGSINSVDGVEVPVKNTGLYVDFVTLESSIKAISAKSADAAVRDSEGNAINETYVKTVSAVRNDSKITFTITKGDNSTYTFELDDNDTTYKVFKGVQGSTDGTLGLVPGPLAEDANKFLKADGTWANPVNTEYGNMTGATATTAGSSGLVPAPKKGDNTKFLSGDGTFKSVETADTKNTVGATASTEKLFIVGATDQTANPESHTNAKAYISSNGHMYSNDKQVINASDVQALTNKTYEGYTLGDAAEKSVATVIEADNTSLATSGDVYTAVQKALSDAKAYTNSTVGTSIGGVVQFGVEVVAELPTENISTSTIYLVPSSKSSANNVKTEYMYIEGQWEIIGSTQIDLSDYVTTSQMNAAISEAVAGVTGSSVSGLSVVDGKLCITYETI